MTYLEWIPRKIPNHNIQLDSSILYGNLIKLVFEFPPVGKNQDCNK